MFLKFGGNLVTPVVFGHVFEGFNQLIHNILDVLNVGFGQAWITLLQIQENDFVTLLKHRVNIIDGLHRVFIICVSSSLVTLLPTHL